MQLCCAIMQRVTASGHAERMFFIIDKAATRRYQLTLTHESIVNMS